MKAIALIFSVFTLLFCSVQVNSQEFVGAFKLQKGDIEQVVAVVDGYLSHTTYDLKNKKFISTRGGELQIQDTGYSVKWQYDTQKTADGTPVESWLGQTSQFDFNLVDGGVQTNLSGNLEVWQMVDGMATPLTGVWRMTGRKQGDQISKTTLQSRRTLKILTGNRFQWVAINIQTGQFSGTGGGTYTFKDGKYTENIEFFSRDDSRVGMSLTFDGQIVDGEWHHSGNSSTGNYIYEIWGKLEK